MPLIATRQLKNEFIAVFKKQGYAVKRDGLIVLRENDREAKRRAHAIAKRERIIAHLDFIKGKSAEMRKHMIDGKDLNIQKIDPVLIEVEAGSKWEEMFRWWNIIWWSLPYERAYGRQMRFIVWDKYHNAPIGLIGLQSPLLSWGVRDTHLGIPIDDRDYWVNQSLNAQRIGALPPYNAILGGKLVAMLMTSDPVRRSFSRKYKDQKTVLKKRILPANLLFITTTGAYGKSSVYARLKYENEAVAEFLGYTQGSGTFHVPNALYEKLILYLQKKNYDVRRGYGNGPSRKLRLIDHALSELGFQNGAVHGIQRAVYLFPAAKNLKEVIQKDARPKWHRRPVEGIVNFWKKRWAIPRAGRDQSYFEFNSEEFVKKTMADLKKYKRYCQTI